MNSTEAVLEDDGAWAVEFPGTFQEPTIRELSDLDVEPEADITRGAPASDAQFSVALSLTTIVTWSAGCRAA